jgi:hypothetical protein
MTDHVIQDGIANKNFENVSKFNTVNNYNGYSVEAIATNGSTRVTFHLPDYAKRISKMELYAFVSAGAAQTLRDVDFTGNFCAEKEPYNQHSFSDTTTTYDLSAYSDRLYAFDITTLLTSALPGDFVGVTIVHNAVGGAINYINVGIYYYM